MTEKREGEFTSGRREIYPAINTRAFSLTAREMEGIILLIIERGIFLWSDQSRYEGEF